MGNPIAVGAEKLEEAFAEDGLREFGHGEARGRAIQARVIGHGAKDGDAAIGGAMGLEAFEEGLTVVEGGEGRREGHWAEGPNARVVPLAVVPIGDEHVVAVIGAKGRCLAKFFREAGVRGAGDGDGGGHDGPGCERDRSERVGGVAPDEEEPKSVREE